MIEMRTIDACSLGRAVTLAIALLFSDVGRCESGSIRLDVEAGTSVQQVFARVSDIRKRQDPKGLIEVVFAPGEYPIREAVVLSPEAGGDENCRVVYRSADSDRPAVITGGRRISGWWKDEDGAWHVTLPDVRNDKWNFTRLFVNGIRRFRPRFPVEGYSLAVSNVIHSSKGPVDKEPGLVAGFAYEDGSIDESWANREDLELFNLQKWNTSRMRIGSLDGKERVVRFTEPRYCTSGHSAYRGTRFWVENVKEMFGAPGSWYLDRPTGELKYMPCAGETPEDALVEAPVAERLLLVRGCAERDVANVEFRDIVFRMDGHGTPVGGSFGVQAAFQVPAAVELVRAHHVDFRGCVLTQLGGYGIAFGPGTHDCRVSDTLMRDLGAGGVKMGAPYKGYADVQERSPQPMGENVPGFRGKAWDLTHHITIENCHVTGAGRIFPDAVGMLCLRASYNRFVHNEIDDLYYSGVSIGWDWSGAPTMSHHNEVAYNHIHDIGQRMLSDMGFVYLLGRAPGTSVHHNYLHDISCFAYGGTGIYPDEASSGVESHHNLVRNTMRSYHQNQNGGARNVAHDNVFLYGRVYQYDYTVPWDRPDNVEVEMRRNVFVWRPTAKSILPNVRYTDGRNELNAPVPFGSGIAGSSNVYWRTDGKADVFAKRMDLATWGRTTGAEAGSVYADPLIEDLPNGGVRFRPGSPALALGIEVLDVDETGPSGGAPKCAAFASAPVAGLYEERMTTISDGRLEVVLDERDAGLVVTDRETGAKWASEAGAVTNVFHAVMEVRKLASDKLRFNVAAVMEGFAKRSIDISVRHGVLVFDIVRVAGAAWPIPERLNDLDDVAYPYALKPLNAAAHGQTPRIVRNAFIEVVP